MPLPSGVLRISATQDVGRGAAAPVGDRCFVHPHGYVEGASGRDQEVVVMGGAYVSVRD